MNESRWHPSCGIPFPIKLLSVPQLFVVPPRARGFDVVSHIKVAVDVVVCIVFIRNQGQEVVHCLGKCNTPLIPHNGCYQKPFLQNLCNT
jgi:hypothetical protein